jgi:nitroreductase
MELRDVMRTTGTVRRFRSDQVPDDLLYRIFEVARFAPQGGNRQPMRWVVVRDPETKRRLQTWYEPVLRRSFEAYAASAGVDLNSGQLPTAAREPLHLAEHFHEVPVVVFACVDVSLLRPDAPVAGAAQLERTNLIDGGFVFPAVQNFLLACRDEGLGTALTSALTVNQDEIRQLLEVPERFLVAAAIAVGRPERPFPTRLRRDPVETVVYDEKYGIPLFMGSDGAGT